MAFNTVAYNKYDYVAKLRDRLNKPSTWRDVMEVIYTNNYSKIDGYISTESSVVAGTRGTAYRYNAFTITAETLTISSTKMVASFIDEIDRAQQTYVNQMTMAEYHGKQMSEEVETLVLAEHGSWVNFGIGDLTDPTADDDTQITVSASNIDDIIRAVKTKIYTNNGVDLSIERGVFLVLRPQDFQALEAFAQAGIKFIGLIKSSLINGEHLIAKAKATLSKALCQLQRLSERTLLMSEATVRTT